MVTQWRIPALQELGNHWFSLHPLSYMGFNYWLFCSTSVLHKINKVHSVQDICHTQMPWSILFPLTIPLWNGLPPAVVTADHIPSFVIPCQRRVFLALRYLCIGCPYICPSVKRPSVFLFLDNNKYLSVDFHQTWYVHWNGGDLLMGKCLQFLTELSAHETIMAGYYRVTFLLYIFITRSC